jgi:hypothetical protein
MRSPRRLIVALTLLGYGAVPASTACDYGPHFDCAKRGEACNMFGGCCEGLECNDNTNTCERASITANAVESDTARDQH